MVYNNDMNIVYCGIAAKYTHSMPAGWFLAEYLAGKGLAVSEIYHNINEDYSGILRDILSKEPEILLFSVYIFNVMTVKQLIKDVKEKTDCKIVAGGPEADDTLGADCVIYGEGEQALYNYLTGKKATAPLIENLDDIPSPYTAERLAQAKNKLIYYESSRGCPFCCAYCAANSGKVRYFSLQRVKEDLKRIVASGAKTVKFTDRTFNLHYERADAILNFIKENFGDSGACFHFEIMGELLKESTIDILLSLPPGLVQLEIGVQSLNPASLSAVGRNTDPEKLKKNIVPLIRAGNIHIHMDLIAGLPCESLDTFIRGFDRVFGLRPNVLQLGFLKLLKGAPIRENFTVAVYSPYPPYEVEATPDMGMDDFAMLKDAEFALNKLYNSGALLYSLEYLFAKSTSPCKTFMELGSHLKKHKIDKLSQRHDYFRALLDYEDSPRFKELLRLDFLCSDGGKKIPRFLRGQRSAAFSRYKGKPKEDAAFYEQFAYLPWESEAGVYILKFDYSRKHPVRKRYGCELIARL
jgi:radical SAM superfamily enzyme YgiQ (UPF0313 family)